MFHSWCSCEVNHGRIFLDESNGERNLEGMESSLQRLLGSGVYLPLRKVGISRPVTRLLVFVVSGMGHVYPCYVAGLSLHLISFMMIFFIVQVLLVSFEDVVGIRSGVWCIGIEIVLSPLFVMPVLFFTDPALIGMV